MKNSLSFLFVFFLLLIGLPILSSSQNSQDSIKYRIETIDGNEYTGKILEKTADKIKILSDKLGEISISNSDVKVITEISSVSYINGKYWFENPQSTRYFWTPNGYNLKKGEGYYQNVWIMFNQAIYGITNHISVGVGTIPLFMFAGASTPAWVTVKFSQPIVENKLNVGAGALMGTVIGEPETGFGILYGITTLGSKDKNLNIGLGWAYAGGKIASSPTLNISAMIRTGPKGYFLTENYFIGTADNFIVMMMVGGRRIIKHTGLDYGAIIPLGGDIGTFVAVPWLGLTIPFGSRN